MRVVPVPCLKDNYAYLVIDGDRAAVVDPSEAAPVEAALAREAVTLAAVWLTHHHWDHVGGVPALAASRPDLEVVASTIDAAKIKGVTRTVDDGDEVTLGAVRATILANPGHTLGAITFVADGCAFTGDTLFGAGCGRMFEGDAAMFSASLARLAALPADTRVYFGHEYTAANLRFAAAVEPANQAITDRAGTLAASSVPSTIAVERTTNPFLRVTEAVVIAAARDRGAADDAASVFGAIRAWKDSF